MKRLILSFTLVLSMLLVYSQEADNTNSVTGNLVGDFHGNVKIDRDLYSPDSGNSDMKAYIYGTVNERGNKVASCSTNGFTVSKHADGIRKITFTGNDKPLNKNSYVVLATNCSSMHVIVTVWQEKDYFLVVTKQIDETPAIEGRFNFVMYKK